MYKRKLCLCDALSVFCSAITPIKKKESELMKSVILLCIILILSLPVAGLCDDIATTSTVEQKAVAVCFRSEKRTDDFAWENDKIGFRIYGNNYKNVSSAPDIWAKKVRYPVVKKFYHQGKSYHKDWGEGLDFYSMGKACGAGGSGLWIDGKLHMPPLWKEAEVITSDGDTAKFALTFKDWAIEGDAYQEKRTMELKTGDNLFKVHADYETPEGVDDLMVAVGIGKLKGKGEFEENAEAGTLVYWSEETGKDGRLGIAVVVDPEKIKGFKDLGHSRVVLIEAGKDHVVEYYAGACWSKGLDFQTREQWEGYVQSFAEKKSEDWE